MNNLYLFQIAIGTLFLNLSVSQTNYADQTICNQIAESILDFLTWSSDLEACYRSYRALGNLLCTPYGQTIGALIISTDVVTEKIRVHMSSSVPNGFEKLNEIARDIINTL